MRHGLGVTGRIGQRHRQRIATLAQLLQIGCRKRQLPVTIRPYCSGVGFAIQNDRHRLAAFSDRADAAKNLILPQLLAVEFAVRRQRQQTERGQSSIHLRGAGERRAVACSINRIDVDGQQPVRDRLHIAGGNDRAPVAVAVHQRLIGFPRQLHAYALPATGDAGITAQYLIQPFFHAVKVAITKRCINGRNRQIVDLHVQGVGVACSLSPLSDDRFNGVWTVREQ